MNGPLHGSPFHVNGSATGRERDKNGVRTMQEREVGAGVLTAGGNNVLARTALCAGLNCTAAREEHLTRGS